MDFLKNSNKILFSEENLKLEYEKEQLPKTLSKKGSKLIIHNKQNIPIFYFLKKNIPFNFSVYNNISKCN